MEANIKYYLNTNLLIYLKFVDINYQLNLYLILASNSYLIKKLHLLFRLQNI